MLLETALPGRPPCTIGVLLIDPEPDGWFRLRRNFDAIADPDDVEVLEASKRTYAIASRNRAPRPSCDRWRISRPTPCASPSGRRFPVDAFSRVLDRLYRDHVEDTGVQQFRTHLPLYSLRAAAGGLGEEMESAAEDWVPAPEGMHLSPDLFVAHVVGRSMEPRIPDGSLNLFRLHPVGSRQGKILLIERFGVLDETARYTIKRYTSRKVFRARTSGSTNRSAWSP